MDGKQVECLSSIIAVLILGIVIIVHEFGHFLLAKTNGIVVEEFSVGMGPRILSTQRGTTRYSLKLIPFGGSCMMRGEDGEDNGEGTFNSKSVWRRFSVIAAGPIFNFILAFVFSFVILSWAGIDLPVLDKGPVIGIYPPSETFMFLRVSPGKIIFFKVHVPTDRVRDHVRIYRQIVGRFVPFYFFPFPFF